MVFVVITLATELIADATFSKVRLSTQQTRPFDLTVCLGRNGWDSPLMIPDDMAVEVANWRFTGALGKKREGSVSVVLTGDPVTGYYALARFLPGQDPTLEELFIVDTTGKICRVPVAAAIDLTLADAYDDPTRGYLTTFVQHHGKLVIAYNSAVNRLHVYDPATSTTTIRRSGLATPGAPTVADTGAGTYPATLRYYRVNYKTLSGTTVLRVSNLGANVSFTPSGTGLAARVTKPAASGDGETHWQLHGSADDLAYYQLSGDLPVATTTFDDTVNPEDYALGTLSPLVGANTPFPSVKFLGSDGLHLFGLGVWETAAGDAMPPVPGRVYFSPALGSSDTGDDERVSNTLTQQGWIDCSPEGGGVDRGLSGPLNNRMYAFQSKGIYMLVPTGDPIAPFARVVMTNAYGSVNHWSQVIGEDQDGQPALYFLDPGDGPRRISVGRTIEWLGKDVSDVWQTVNQNAPHVACGLYDHRRKLVLWWVAIGVAMRPNVMIVFDVARGRSEATSILRYGWSVYDGALASAYCAVLFSQTLATERSLTKVPYVGNAAPLLLRQDGTLNTDAGTAYPAFLRSKPFTGGTLRRRKRILEAYLVAKAGPATVTQTLTKDFGAGSATSSQSLVATGTETRVRKFFDATDIADLIALQVTLGDGSALDQTFELDQWIGADELESGAR
jgi:hypothetical protein